MTKVHGSIVTLHFGQPSLMVGRSRVRRVLIDGVPDLPQRVALVRSEWLLTVYICEWDLAVGEIKLAHCESDDITMIRALKVLEGQKLTRVHVAPLDGVTRFDFDLRAVLTCRPADSGVYSDSPVTMWWMSDEVSPVAVRDDATFSAHSTTAKREDHQRRSLSMRN